MGVQSVRIDTLGGFGNASTTAPVFPIIASGFVISASVTLDTAEFSNVTVTLPDNTTVLINGIEAGKLYNIKCRSVAPSKGTAVYLF